MSPSRLTIEAWPVTDAGQAEENQDTVLIYEPRDPSVGRFSGNLYVVADGLGAGSSGQLASQYAAQRIMHYYYTSDEPDLGLRLKDAVQTANADLFAYAEQQPELVKLGATLVAAAIRGEELHIASVGDSRAYLIRDGQIQQLTRDHTLVQQLIDEEAITPEEAVEHPRRDVVLRSLGAEDTVRADVFDLRLRPDDALVLCSDGLTHYMHQDEIAALVGSVSPRSAAETLLRKVLDRGGKDNVTIVAALARDGAPLIHTDTPYTWDGQPASFEKQQTLLQRPEEIATPDPNQTVPSGLDVRSFLEANAPIGTSLPPEEEAGDTIRTQAQRREEPAPPYQPAVQPAPPYTGQTQVAPPYPGQPQNNIPPSGYPQATPPQGYPAPDPSQQMPPAQAPYAGQRGAPRSYGQQTPPPPPPGYAIDPVTGLPPVPPQGGYAQPGYPQQNYPQGGAYAPRVYQPPAQPHLRAPRRGISLGTLMGAGILAVMLTALMVVVLVNPMNWELPLIGGTSEEGTPVAGAEGTPATPSQATTAAPGVAATGEATQEAAGPAVSPTPSVAPTNPAPPNMVLIDGGPFIRGVTDEEARATVLSCIQESTEDGDPACLPDYFNDAQPVEEVTLSPFYIDITEVTNREYAACVASEVCSEPGDTRYYADPNYAEHPAVFVTWEQARQFCTWAGERLPTEAEWEKAARWDPAGAKSTVYPWGDNFEEGRANLAGRGNSGTSAVRAYAQDISAYLVIGMAGNVSEWVADWYFRGYEGLGTLNPTGPANQPLSDPFRVVRGGSFRALASYARAGHRQDVPPQSSRDYIGFRCVADVGGAPAPTVTPGVTGTAALPATITPTGTVTPNP